MGRKGRNLPRKKIKMADGPRLRVAQLHRTAAPVPAGALVQGTVLRVFPLIESQDGPILRWTPLPTEFLLTWVRVGTSRTLCALNATGLPMPVVTPQYAHTMPPK